MLCYRTVVKSARVSRFNGMWNGGMENGMVE